MRLARTLAFVLVASAVAGCFGHSQPPTSSPIEEPRRTEARGQTETIPQPLPNGTVREVPAQLVLESCTGWHADHPLLPESMVPGDVPSGWESANPTDSPDAGIGVSGFTCAKASIGPFERGPIDLILDSHTKGVRPHDCQSGRGGTGHLILAQIIVSDADLAQYLNTTYGMPAHFGQVEQTVQSLPAGEARTWSWAVAGNEDSTITVLTDDTQDTVPRITWYWWTHGNGLGRFEMDQQITSSQYSSRSGYGKFAEPMLMARVADGNFEGPADYFTDITTINTFGFYQDTLCTPPDKGT